MAVYCNGNMTKIMRPNRKHGSKQTALAFGAIGIQLSAGRAPANSEPSQAGMLVTFINMRANVVSYHDGDMHPQVPNANFKTRTLKPAQSQDAGTISMMSRGGLPDPVRPTTSALSFSHQVVQPFNAAGSQQSFLKNLTSVDPLHRWV